MKKQQPILVIDNPEAAQALREAQFLGYFLEPSSPSDVAKRAGIAANLMHHHTNRFLELGLLFEVKRENRKVFYQLAAENFRVPTSSLPADEELTQSLQELSSVFTKAYERSNRLNASPDYLNFGFAQTIPEDQLQPSDNESLEARPTHYQMRSFRLGASSYRKLVCLLSDLIIDAETESSDGAAQCTIALLAFEGSVIETSSKDGWEVLHMKGHVPGVRMLPLDQTNV